MKMSKLHKKLVTIAAGALLGVGIASQALAAPVFTIKPSAIPGTANANFTADKIDFTTSELLTLGSPGANQVSGSGWGQATSFVLNNNPIFGNVTGLGNTYGIFITFNLINTLATGTMGAANSTYNMNLLDFKFWADPTLTNVFTSANATTATNATYTDPGANDILLASGSLISGVAGFDALGGAFLNSIENFAVCTGAGTSTIGGVATPNPACTSGIGNTFFAAPVPFFDLAFDAFNNTTQGILRNGNLISVNQAVGAVDFNRVPEPTTLLLLGIGLMGMGASLRRRKA